MGQCTLRRVAKSGAGREIISIRPQRGLQHEIWIEYQRKEGIRVKAGPFSIKATRDVQALSLAILICVLSDGEALCFFLFYSEALNQIPYYHYHDNQNNYHEDDRGPQHMIFG
jgi:hypothetical protein